MDENINQVNNKDSIPVIKTYSSDMADVIRNKEMSVIKIAMAEKEKQEREQTENNFQKGMSGLSKFFLIFGSIIFILGGVAGVYYFNQKKINSNVSITTQTDRQTIISYDQKFSIDVTGKNGADNLLNIINSEKNNVEQSKSIKAIFLTELINGQEELTSINNIFSLNGINIPSSVKRSLTGEYMIGVYNPDQTQGTKTIKPSLFLILKTNDYNIIYSGMLLWEPTMMNDFKKLFITDQASDSFKDILINNKDARVMYSAKGEGLLYYLFTDKNTLIITDNQETIKEIINRSINKKK